MAGPYRHALSGIALFSLFARHCCKEKQTEVGVPAHRSVGD
jgi:hypothetical protein